MLKGRPTDNGVGRGLGHRNGLQILRWRKHWPTTMLVRAPFQGAPHNPTNPGLKPWAVLFSHFVAISRAPHRPFAPSPVRPFAGAPLRPFIVPCVRHAGKYGSPLRLRAKTFAR